MKTLFYLARHGTTTDSNKGIFRGNRDAMLDKQGFHDAHEVKDFLAKKDWDRLFSSHLTRSIQTAKVIASAKDKEPDEPIPDLRPWDIGYLTGKDKKQYAPDMKVFIDNPEMIPQDGESRNQFFDRVQPLLINAMEIGLHGEPCVIIAHSSIIHALAHFLWGDNHKPLAVKPGGVIEVFVNKKGDIDARAIFKPGKDDSSFAADKSQQPTS